MTIESKFTSNVIPSGISRRSFLKSAAMTGVALPMAGVLAAQADQTAGPLMAYVGTFSSPLRDVLPTQVDLPPGNGRGIHLFEVDRDSGALAPRGVYEMGTSPSCLTFNAAGTRLYSANETDRVGEGKEGTVSAFAVDRNDGQLKLLNTVRSGGAGPTYVSVHPSGKFLLVANYFGGSVSVLPILADGSLGDATDVKVDEGTIGPRKPTNAPAGTFAFSGHDRTHAHMIQADPSGRFVRAYRSGPGQIYVWKLDESKGMLIPNDPPAVSLPPGDGPRHFSFHPNGRWFYSIQEEGSNVVLFDWDAEEGPSGRQADHLDPAARLRGQQLLLRNHGLRRRPIPLRRQPPARQYRDLLHRRRRTLVYRGEEWSHGNYPRSFNFDPTGRFLYCCNQRADNVAVFRVDRKTGRPDLHRPLRPRRQSVDHRVSRSGRKDEVATRRVPEEELFSRRDAKPQG